ncbi:MAG: hypothetical protein JOY90_00545 [Bradyrhizobium sp.]|uniref:hypothetical protein n=1 Tax=Bradyrhizobium sp. TaxID=376 RepID=UPI001DD59759|nr:hypothetical protein [Bradyrhizobium sp.]MBV9558944.1 hypothetical protein [Bradyrhizobium sp.]
MGIIVGTWHFGEPQSDFPGDESSIAAAVAVRLHAATGLRVEQREDGTLRIPKLGRLTFLAAGEELFDWAFNDHIVTVHAGIPAHPYLWENLDAVMRAAGGRRDTDVCVWQPNPAHARLQTCWDSLSPRDRFLLAMPSLWGARPFDRLLSQP